MNKDEAALAMLEKALKEPEPLEVVGQAIEQAGAWVRWTFDRQLWYRRARSHVTQAELARRSGISQARISRLEAGADVKLSTLRTLWAALGYEPQVLPDRIGRERKGRPYRKRSRRRRAAPPMISPAK